MNISENILEYLKEHGSAPVPGFGVFALENSKAIISADKNSILPPAKQIVFSPDYQLENDSFLNFISKKENVSAGDAKRSLTIQTDFWKKKISAAENFEVKPLGKFIQSGENLIFKGERIERETPDFYGLEEIKLAEIKNSATTPSAKSEEYRANKSLLYTILVALPMIGILAAAYWKKDVLFGKKSFDSLAVSKPVKLPKKDTAKIAIPVSDSLKIDSLKKDSAKTIAPAPVKWNGNKNHYKKSKWKQKKHQSR